MDQTYADRKFNKVQSIIDKMSLDELIYALGRYCGPGNIILCEKKYGCGLPKALVEEAIKHRQFEEAFGLQTK